MLISLSEFEDVSKSCTSHGLMAVMNIVRLLHIYGFTHVSTMHVPNKIYKAKYTSYSRWRFLSMSQNCIWRTQNYSVDQTLFLLVQLKEKSIIKV